jgi:putative cardiolipin synthase
MVILLANPIFPQKMLKDFLMRPSSREVLKKLTMAESTINKVTLLHLGKRSKPARLKLIDEAREYIFTTVPYWFNDQEGKEYLRVFQEKRKKMPEIDMRLILGWAGEDMLAELFPSKKFIQIKEVFSGLIRWNTPGMARAFSMDLLKHRMHDKMLIVDGERLVMGGLNVADEYLQGGLTRAGWHDTDVLIEGPAAQEAAKLFIKNWELMKLLKSSKSFPPFKKQWVKLFKELYFSNKDYWEFKLPPKTRPRKLPLYDIRKVQFPLKRYFNNPKYFPPLKSDDCKSPVWLIYDTPFADLQSKRPYKPYSKTQRTIEYLLKHCKKSAKFFIPYPTFNLKVRKTLEKAAKRGIEVSILTNSAQSVDIPATYYGSFSHFLPLALAGVKIYEWQGHSELLKLEKDNQCKILNGWPGNTVHTKAIVFDDSVVMIGSHNLNVRSDNYNTEIMALIIDEPLGKELANVFAEDIDDSHPITIECNGKKFPAPRKARRLFIKDIIEKLESYKALIKWWKNFRLYL